MPRKRSIRGKSNHGAIFRQPCRYYLKGTCTRSPCEYWHPPGCQFYKTETGCKAEDKCLFPHHKVDEQQNKKPKQSHFPKEEKAAIVKIVPQLGCVSQDSETLVSQSGKQYRENPVQKVLEPIQRVRFTVYATSSKYPGQERTIVGKNKCQSSSSAKSLRREI